MTPLLGRIERLLERAFEVPSQRLFHTRMQPIELARALGRAIVSEHMVGPDSVEVPNDYEIGLHPDDYRWFAGRREGLQRDLAEYVVQQCQRRGWRYGGRPVVALREAEQAQRGRPLVVARVVDRPRAGPELGSDPVALESTSVLPPVARQRSASPGPARLRLQLADGGEVDLSVPSLRIGRALDNDVVLEHESVSRYHAELRLGADGVKIVDLGSTNGTRLNGEPVRECLIAAGDTIHVGAVPLRCHATG